MQTTTKQRETMNDQTYNGWTNYATWGVALVLDNDEGTYTIVRERVAEIVAAAADHHNVPEIWTAEKAALFDVADFVKDFTEELCGLGGEEYGLPEPSMMASQVIGAGLAAVDWEEIAGHLVEE